MSIKDSSIIKVEGLLQKQNLEIPPYQRPYKWTEKNVNQLIDDIIENSGNKKSAYRLGTLVLYEKDNKLEIVDGQQRTITLALIAYSICEYLNKTENKDKLDFLLRAGQNINNYSPKFKLSFHHKLTLNNISENTKIIKRRINDFDKESILFFFKKCELVCVTLTNLTEAFQFFDSQNARGKELEPHDYLKAFHLREMSSFSSEEEKRIDVFNWEKMDTEELSELFSKYLYRIKMWGNNYSSMYFTKDDVDIFKGVSPDVHEEYPYAKIYRIANYYTDEYNNSYYKKINRDNNEYPFQIDQPIINGNRFFQMISHYKNLLDSIKNIDNEYCQQILQTITTYEGANRKGDKAVRSMFYTALLYYIDRFGFVEIEKAIFIIFLWAYRLRLILQNVGPDSIDNYGAHKKHSKIPLIKKIKEAYSPYDIVNLKIDTIKENTIQNKPTKVEAIKKIFKERQYYE